MARKAAAIAAVLMLLVRGVLLLQPLPRSPAL
jgi:hypothetical protein